MKLAIKGGEPIRKEPFSNQRAIKIWDIEDLTEIGSGEYGTDFILSHYRGNWIPEFYGGPEIKRIEEKFCEKFNALNTIMTNSCTSALQILCGAIPLEPDDEVIVTPWSMSCSATAPLLWKAKPVFADIEKETFCLDPKSVEEKITNKTRAIIVVDLFGQPFAKEINELAVKHNLFIIEDAAQAIGSTRGNEFAGTLGDAGTFSFTQGKHITCGEGGAIITNNNNISTKSRFLMNHSEAVYSSAEEQLDPIVHFVNSHICGFNMRMTEIQAFLLQTQLRKLYSYIDLRRKNVNRLKELLKDIPFIEFYPVREGCTHSYYVLPIKFKEEYSNNISRNRFVDALIAELPGEESRPNRPLLGKGYIKPLYRMPIFKYNEEYKNVYLPNVERLWGKELFLTLLHGLPLVQKDLQEIANAFYKVTENMEELL